MSGKFIEIILCETSKFGRNISNNTNTQVLRNVYEFLKLGFIWNPSWIPYQAFQTILSCRSWVRMVRLVKRKWNKKSYLHENKIDKTLVSLQMCSSNHIHISMLGEKWLFRHLINRRCAILLQTEQYHDWTNGDLYEKG